MEGSDLRSTGSGNNVDSVNSRPAYLMLALIALAAVGIFGTLWLVGRSTLTELEEALARQPAELVMAPEVFQVSETQGFGECPQLSTQILALDVSDGSVMWEQTVPNPYQEFYGEWFVLTGDDDQAVLAQIDAGLNDILPSVRAVDIATGELAWQRFLEVGAVYRSAQSTSELVMEAASVEDGTFGRGITFAVNADGELNQSPPVQFQSDQPFDPSMQLESGFWLTSGVADVVVDGDLVRQVYAGGGDGGQVDIWTVADNSTVSGDRIPFDEVYQYLGSGSSLGAPMQANEDLILTVIGSPVGPNTRLAVFDGESGVLQWSIEDTRAGALAGNRLLYDKRNDEPVEAASTRDLYLVEGDNPDKVIWSTALGVNEAGGNGYLGTVGDELVFAVDSDQQDLEFLFVGGEGDVPDLLQAAEGFGSGPSGRHHVDQDILVAGTELGFVVVTAAEFADGGVQATATDQPVRWVRRVGDRVLVVASDEPLCG